MWHKAGGRTVTQKFGSMLRGIKQYDFSPTPSVVQTQLQHLTCSVIYWQPEHQDKVRFLTVRKQMSYLSIKHN